MYTIAIQVNTRSYNEWGKPCFLVYSTYWYLPPWKRIAKHLVFQSSNLYGRWYLLVEYIGCIRDGRNRVLTDVHIIDDQMTLELCFSICADYVYAMAEVFVSSIISVYISYIFWIEFYKNNTVNAKRFINGDLRYFLWWEIFPSISNNQPWFGWRCQCFGFIYLSILLIRLMLHPDCSISFLMFLSRNPLCVQCISFLFFFY